MQKNKESNLPKKRFPHDSVDFLNDLIDWTKPSRYEKRPLD